MADCGASGSALDRAAAAIISSGGRSDNAAAPAISSATKAVSSFLGGVSVSSGVASASAPLMPSAPPNQLAFVHHTHAAPSKSNNIVLPRPNAAAYYPSTTGALHDQQYRFRQMEEAWHSTAASSSAHHPQFASHHEGSKMFGPSPSQMDMSHTHPAMVAQQQQQYHHHHLQQMQQMQYQMQMQVQMNHQMRMIQAQQQQQQKLQQHHHQQQQQQQQLQFQQQQLQFQQQQLQFQQQQQQQLQVNEQRQQLEQQRKVEEQQKQPAEIMTEKGAASNAISESTTEQQDVTKTWHVGLEEEFQSELRNYRATEQKDTTLHEDDDDGVVSVGGEEIGHEGIVDGVTIEQLAAAWADAEAEYSAANLGSSYYNPNLDIDKTSPELHPYEFSDASQTHATATTTAEHDGKEADVPPDVDYMAEGMRHFHGGNIKEAILAFERELRHIDADNADAWRMLGKCHAENDEDRKAIACLERAVDRDPYSPEALLALGVSYVNELDHDGALRNLKAWITHNPKYAGMDIPTAEEDLYGDVNAGGESSEFEEVQKLLLRALEHDPTDAADVQEALGVIYNVSRNYEAAVDAFRKAIEARPDDYQLWNKLGATLANSNRSEEALPAYHRALRIKPRYARAWLNMAISHSNLANYDEAARCYLQTLSLNPSAGHCWSYLRIALTCSERWDLLPLAASQDLSAFREHFDFVQYDV